MQQAIECRSPQQIEEDSLITAYEDIRRHLAQWKPNMGYCVKGERRDKLWALLFKVEAAILEDAPIPERIQNQIYNTIWG